MPALQVLVTTSILLSLGYLAAKRDRAGHYIDLEGLLACSNKD